VRLHKISREQVWWWKL